MDGWRVKADVGKLLDDHGMRSVLRALIADCRLSDADYLIQLAVDLDVALLNYESRYERKLLQSQRDRDTK